MPKTASSTARANELQKSLEASRNKPFIRLQYYDGSAWLDFQDVKSFNFQKTSTRDKIATFGVVPQPKSAGASMSNARSQYSPSSSGRFADVLEIGLPIRASVGYYLSADTGGSHTITLSGYSRRYHTEYSSSAIINSSTAVDDYVELPGITKDWCFYGTAFYGTRPYNAEGYYEVAAYDIGSDDLWIDRATLSVTATSAKTYCFYRSCHATGDFAYTNYTLAGECVNGTATFTMASIKRYTQLCFVFATSAWGSGSVTAASFSYAAGDRTAEFFDQGEFLVDDASFGSSYSSKDVSLNARDYLKFALETEISLPAYSNEPIGSVIRDICERCGIYATSTSIPDTAYTVTVANGTFTNQRASDLLAKAMQYLSGKDVRYRLFLDDSGVLTLDTQDVSTINFDFLFDYVDYMFSFSRSFKSDNLLQRVTVLSKDGTVDSEVLLASQFYNTTGAKTLSWSGDAVYKRVALDISTGGVFTITQSNLTSIDFTITGTTPNITVQVYGDKLSSFTGYAGEGGIVKTRLFVPAQYNNGFTYKITNEFVQSDDDAQDIAEALYARYGNQVFEADLSMQYHPLLAVNDKILLVENNTKTFTIFVIENIGAQWDANGNSMKGSYRLRDIGATLDYIQWDRHNVISGGKSPGIDDLLFDEMFWDLDIWTADSDTDTYTRPLVGA